MVILKNSIVANTDTMANQDMKQPQTIMVADKVNMVVEVVEVMAYTAMEHTVAMEVTVVEGKTK